MNAARRTSFGTAALIPAGLLDVLLKRPDFHTFICLDTYFFRFNVTRKPFDDPRVRQALALAVDKERIVKKITQGGEQPASHLVPDGTANYTSAGGIGLRPGAGAKIAGRGWLSRRQGISPLSIPVQRLGGWRFKNP